MTTNLLLERRKNLTEYFRDELTLASAKLDANLQEHSEFYIVNLLNDFRRTEQLFELMEEELQELPLAMILERAVHGEDQATKIRTFKQLGDRALFVAGYFPERTARTVDVDYYITMGSGAYHSLTTLFTSRDPFAEVFSELAEKFSLCVDLIGEVQRAGKGDKNADLLRYYERWLATGCKRMARILREEGIPLTDPVTTRQ
jgi:hypothetical protein